MVRTDPGRVRFPVQYHKSAVIISVFGILFLVALAVFTFFAESVVGAGEILLVAILFQLSVYPQWYTLSGKDLRFRSGIWTLGKVNLDEVTSVRLDKGWPLSHTLYPIRGIRLTKGKGSMFIIPRDEPAFFEAALRVCPRLQDEITKAQSGGNS